MLDEERMSGEGDADYRRLGGNLDLSRTSSFRGRSPCPPIQQSLTYRPSLC